MFSGYIEGIIILICELHRGHGREPPHGVHGDIHPRPRGLHGHRGPTAAILSVRHDVPWLPVAVIAGGVLAMALAHLIGVPTLKLMGDYFCHSLHRTRRDDKAHTGELAILHQGARGFPGVTNFTTLPVAASFFLGMLILMRFLINGNYGRAFKACRDDYIAASLLGFKTAHYRVLSLTISGFYCGIAGALLAGFLTYLQPVMFDMNKSTELTAVVVFGGLGSLSGSIIGTAVIGMVTEVFRPISQYRMLIYGATMVLIMVVRPEGIMGQHEIGPRLIRSIFSRKPRNEVDGAHG